MSTSPPYLYDADGLPLGLADLGGSEEHRPLNSWRVATEASLQGFIDEESRRLALLLPGRRGGERQRRPSATSLANHHRRVAAIVADLVYAAAIGPPRLIVSLKHASRSVYRHEAFKAGALRNLLESMHREGLIHQKRGHQRTPTSITPGWRLQAAMAWNKWGLDAVSLEDGQPDIILMGSPRSTFGVRGFATVEYNVSCLTIVDLKKDVERLNRDLAALVACGRLKVDEADGYACDIRDTHMARVFHNAADLRDNLGDPLGGPTDFNLNGTLQGGFWQKMEAADLWRLRIDRKPVAVITMVDPLLRLLYCRDIQGSGRLPAPSRNLFDLGRLDLPPEGVRVVAHAMLFHPGQLDELPEGARLRFPQGTFIRNVEGAIRQNLTNVSRFLGTVLGWKLLFIQSDVILAATRECVDSGIPALPLRGGFIVPRGGATKARRVLDNAFQRRTGVQPLSDVLEPAKPRAASAFSLDEMARALGGGESPLGAA